MADFPIQHLPLLRIVAPPTQGQNLLQQGLQQQATLTQQAVHQAGAPTQQQPFQAGTQHTGQVIAQGAQGRHTLQFPDGRTVDVQAPKNLPVGARVTIEILPNGQAQVTAMTIPASAAKQAALAQLSNNWPALQAAVTQLKQEDPQAAKKLLDRIPMLGGKHFGAQMVRLAQAVMSGDLEDFLGDDLLHLVGRHAPQLMDDLSALQQMGQKENAEGWRAMLFPYVEEDGGQGQGGFYWRHQDDEDGDQHMRFVVNAQLTATGPLQIDGLMRESELLIKVRLHHLPTGLTPDIFREGLIGAAQDAFASAGLSGRIGMEITQTFSVDPLHELLGHNHQFKVEA